MTRSRGFSLLEVMVAVSILGLALTIILSAQAGLAASNMSASNIGTAITLGRCRMTELEEKLLKYGYSEVDEIESNPQCCDEKEVTGFSCDWRIEKILLPNPPMNSIGGDGGIFGGDGGSGFFADGGAFPMGDDGGMPSFGDGGMPSLDIDAGLAGIGGSVTQQLGAFGGPQGILSMAFTMIYPIFKPLMETAIRRITVTVKYKEGPNIREFTLVQYVTNPSRAGLLAGSDAGLMDGGGGLFGGLGGGTPGMPSMPGMPTH